MVEKRLAKRMTAALVMSLLYVAAFAQKPLTGTVVDAAGNAVVGANIIVVGTSNGTMCDLDGRFQLSNVASDATLEISFIGFQTQTVPVNGRTDIRVVLAEDNLFLEEVVMVGYGTQKKANLTGAVAAVDGEVLENRPITNIGQGLQGVVPNLNVTMNNGGAPGAGSSFNIRGATGYNTNTSPLVLVDNVQMDPNLVNPEDIESISVLKDAASAAIYGARASFGVILITTKKGKAGASPKISLSATGYWQTPTLAVHNLNSMDYLTMKDIAFEDGHYYPEFVYTAAEDYFYGRSDSPVLFMPEGGGQYAYKYYYVGNTDWWKELYKPSFSQIYNANISGGTEKTTYYASVGMNNQSGILKNADDKYRKFNATVSVSSQLNKWLNVSAKMMHNFTNELHPTGGTSNMNSTAYSGLSAYSGMFKKDLAPLMPVRHPDGAWAGQGNCTNPAAVQAEGGNAIYKQNDLWMTGAVRITPVKGLVINADYTWNYYGRSSQEHVRRFLEYTAVPGTETYYPWTNPNSVTLRNDDDYYHSLNLFAEYSATVAEDHNFKVMAGYNREKKTYRMHWAGRTNLIDNDTPELKLAYGEIRMNSNASQWAVDGVFARINYDYKGKYLLELNGRYDGSSRFPKGSRYGFFPSVSGAWRLSQEPFWKPVSNWWNNLKIRASYGSLGNQSVSGEFPYLPAYGINTSYGAILNGSRPMAVTAPNPVSGNLTWETVTQVDFGMDAAFFDNRLDLSFDWYRRDTKDMLAPGKTLPGVFGTTVPKENAADMKTLGWELSLGWRNQLSSGFAYHVKAVLSDYKSFITKYDNPTKYIFDWYEGEQLNNIWGYVSNGLFQSQDEIDKHADQSFISGRRWQPGDVKYEDLNGDGRIDQGKTSTLGDTGDYKIIGNSTPRYAYGFTAGFEFAGFDFEMFWQGIGKRDIFGGSLGSYFWGFTGEWDTPLTTALDYWTEDNRDAYFPRPSMWMGGNRAPSSRYMQDASYLRLKNVTLGYTIPSKIMSKVGISRLRVYTQAENILTFTSLIKSVDPETLGNLTYPLNKKFSIGVNLTF